VVASIVWKRLEAVVVVVLVVFVRVLQLGVMEFGRLYWKRSRGWSVVLAGFWLALFVGVKTFFSTARSIFTFYVALLRGWPRASTQYHGAQIYIISSERRSLRTRFESSSGTRGEE